MPPRFSVIVVHHDAPDFLRRCLMAAAEAARGFEHETIVVDNASKNLGDLPLEFPSCRWILSPENRGLGAGVNRAARESRGEILLLLNQDAEPAPSACAEIDRFFRDHATERLGPVGGRLSFADGSFQPSAGPFPHLGNLLWRMALPKRRRKYYLSLPMGRPSKVDWVTGAFVAVRRDLFDRLGGFDENFFLYYEDVDLCLRAARAGFPSYYLPRAEAVHRAPYAVRPNPDSKLKRVIRRSRLLYFQKHRPAWEAWLLSI